MITQSFVEAFRQMLNVKKINEQFVSLIDH